MNFKEKIGLTKYIDGKFGILYIAILASLFTFITNRNSNYILQPSKYIYHYEHGSEALFQLEKKIKDPFKHQQYPPSSNLAKREFRLLVPLIANILGLDYYTIFVFSFLMNVLFIYIFSLILEYNKLDRISNLLLTFGFSFTFLGKCAFSDPMFGQFDVFAFTLILFAYISPLRIKLLLYFLAFWVDERVIISFLFQFLIDLQLKNKKLLLVFQYITVIVLVATCRYFLYLKFNLSTPVGNHADVGLNVLYLNFKQNYILGIFSSFEFGWLYILYYSQHLLKSKSILSIFIALSLGAAIFSTCLVGDISRSSSYLLPLLIYSLLFFKTQMSSSLFKKFAFYYCLSNFLLGSYYYVYGIGLSSLVPNFYYLKIIIINTIAFFY